jgi:hypothetical protein
MRAGARKAWRDYAAGTEARHFSKFAREHLIQSEDRWEGQPLKLEPWQRRMLGEALAYDANGQPVWRSVVMIAPRKNGKTALLAAVALYRLLTDEGRPENPARRLERPTGGPAVRCLCPLRAPEPGPLRSAPRARP